VFTVLQAEGQGSREERTRKGDILLFWLLLVRTAMELLSPPMAAVCELAVTCFGLDQVTVGT